MAQADSPENKEKTHLQVGIIARPHGVRGELKVRLFNEDSQSLSAVSHVVVEPERGPAQLMEIESLRGNAKGLILALSQVTSREGADALRGAKLWVPRSSLEPLAPGEYYLVDLVGCEVTLGGEIIARVSNVRPDPSVDTMVLAMADGSTAEVPIVEAWVGPVDIEARTVQLLSRDGLIV